MQQGVPSHNYNHSGPERCSSGAKPQMHSSQLLDLHQLGRPNAAAQVLIGTPWLWFRPST
jgi:hypothetical protein